MSALIHTGTEKHISVPLGEFLAWAGIPDPENWQARNGSPTVSITVFKDEGA